MSEFRSNSVSQILAVLRYIQQHARNGNTLVSARHRATQAVAQEQTPPIRYQTIEDLYRRRLGLKKVSEFDDIVQRWIDGDSEPLSQILIRHAQPATHNLIIQFFQGQALNAGAPFNVGAPQDSRPPPKPDSVQLSHSEDRMLNFIADTKGLDRLSLLNQIVSQAIRNEFRTLAQQIR
jgi:hypothetical protein